MLRSFFRRYFWRPSSALQTDRWRSPAYESSKPSWPESRASERSLSYTTNSVDGLAATTQLKLREMAQNGFVVEGFGLCPRFQDIRRAQELPFRPNPILFGKAVLSASFLKELVSAKTNLFFQVSRREW